MLFLKSRLQKRARCAKQILFFDPYHFLQHPGHECCRWGFLPFALGRPWEPGSSFAPFQRLLSELLQDPWHWSYHLEPTIIHTHAHIKLHTSSHRIWIMMQYTSMPCKHKENTCTLEQLVNSFNLNFLVYLYRRGSTSANTNPVHRTSHFHHFHTCRWQEKKKRGMNKEKNCYLYTIMFKRLRSVILFEKN